MNECKEFRNLPNHIIVISIKKRAICVVFDIYVNITCFCVVFRLVQVEVLDKFYILLICKPILNMPSVILSKTYCLYHAVALTFNLCQVKAAQTEPFI